MCVFDLTFFLGLLRLSTVDSYAYGAATYSGDIDALVNPTEERLHGIRYCLTLHDRHGTRVMGFDNTHAVKSGKNAKYQGRKTYDHHHRHAKDEGIFYQFIDAHQLLKDFWSEVDKILKKLVVEEV